MVSVNYSCQFTSCSLPSAGLQRRMALPTGREVQGYVAAFREFL